MRACGQLNAGQRAGREAVGVGRRNRSHYARTVVAGLNNGIRLVTCVYLCASLFFSHFFTFTLSPLFLL